MSKIIIGGNVFEVEGSLSMINGKWYDGVQPRRPNHCEHVCDVSCRITYLHDYRYHPDIYRRKQERFY